MSAVSTPEVVLMEPSDSALIAGRDDDVTLTCSASVDRGVVDFGDLVYSFTWYNSEGEVIMSSSRTIISSINNMSTLTLSPLSVDDFNITCSVVVAERLGRLDSSSAAFQYTFINIRGKLRLTIYKYLNYTYIKPTSIRKKLI